MNDLFDYIEFVFNLAEEVTQVLDSIAWVRCASGNVLVCILSFVANLTDVTLADGYTNSVLTDNANRAMAMWQCK